MRSASVARVARLPPAAPSESAVHQQRAIDKPSRTTAEHGANRLTIENCKLFVPNWRNSRPETSARNRAIVRMCPPTSSHPKTQNRATGARFSTSIESLSLIGQVDGGALSIRTHVTDKGTSGLLSLNR
jgi:hypothetical protein